jgi:hypothetical protein
MLLKLKLVVRLLSRSRSGVLKKTEIEAMKMALRSMKSFIYRLLEGVTRSLERIGEGNSVT